MDDVDGVGNNEGVDWRRRWLSEINELEQRIVDDELKRWLIVGDKDEVKLSSSISS